ncbi:hypothetical protein CAPTEDRAFT_68153, partial [Capitella teleta]
LTICPATHTNCTDGPCLLAQHFCDGEADCPDGEDERGCSDCHIQPVFVDWLEFCNCPGRYAPLQFKCAKGGQCISFAKVCDCYDDCEDGSDELCHPTYCKEKRFQGSTGGYCIPLNHVCDGVEDCPFGSDEFNC